MWKNKLGVYICMIVIGLLAATYSQASKINLDSDMQTENKMLIVLSAPSVHNTYYKPAFEEIVEFQIEYARAITGNDYVRILVDEDTLPYYSALPEKNLISANVDDIWMRDFTTINPLKPIQFTYTDASMPYEDSKHVQNSFNTFANHIGITREYSDLYIDGGNIVDNYKGRAITTTRFLEDNNLNYTDGKKILKQLLNANEIAIIEPDEEVLAHSDGMVMWADDNVLLINDYSDEPHFRKAIINELTSSFPGVKIVEVPIANYENTPNKWEGFSSACGIHLNATLTFENIYVPVFGIPEDEKVLQIIQSNTSKKVIPVNAEGVCAMGGSVRCLSWQVAGRNIEKIISSQPSSK